MKDGRIQKRKACASGRYFSNETGSVFLSTIAFVLISMAIVGGLVVVVPGSFGFAQRNKDVLYAIYAAESGLNLTIESVLSLDTASLPIEGSLPGGGYYRVEYIEEDGKRYLQSTGVYNNITRIIKVAVEDNGGDLVFPRNLVDSRGDYSIPDIDVPSMPEFPPGPPIPFNAGITSLGPGTYYFDSITLTNNKKLSIQGPAKVFVEKDLIFENNAMLDLGDGVEVYVKGDVRFKNNVDIKGAGNNKLYLQGSLDFGNNGGWFFPGASSFEMLVGGSITGTNNVEMFQNSTEWNFIYVMGHVDVENNARIGNWRMPNTVLFMPNHDSIFSMKNNTEFYGGIFVPYGTAEFKNNAKVIGSVVYRKLEYKNNCIFIFHDRMYEIRARNDSNEGELGGDVDFGNWSLGG